MRLISSKRTRFIKVKNPNVTFEVEFSFSIHPFVTTYAALAKFNFSALVMPLRFHI